MYLSCYSGVWGEMLLHPPFHEGCVTLPRRRLGTHEGYVTPHGPWGTPHAPRGVNTLHPGVRMAPGVRAVG